MGDMSTLTGILSSMANSISKLTTFTEQQVAYNSMFSSKLQCPIELTERVKYLESETAMLKSCLSKEITALNLSRDLRCSTQKNDIIISGIPDEISDSPQLIVDRVFSALKTSSDLSSEICQVRVINCKSTLTSDTVLRINTVHSCTLSYTSIDKNLAPQIKKSKAVIVSLKSAQARNHVIKQKRVKRDLVVSEVFSNDINSKIYVNEFLPSETYALLTRAKARARELCFRYIWVQAGKIAVKRAEGQPIIFINTLHHIERLR